MPESRTKRSILSLMLLYALAAAAALLIAWRCDPVRTARSSAGERRGAIVGG